jgi:hypothetical protein
MSANLDKAVLDAQQHVKEHGRRHGAPIQELMNAVSGVIGYKFHDGPQGYVLSRFFSERANVNDVIDISVLISRFWDSVFENLFKATPAGAVVPVRDQQVTGVKAEDGKFSRTYTAKPTNLSAVKFLRMQGIAAARKYINDCYRIHLRQHCNDCGQTTHLAKKFEFDTGCNMCDSYASTMLAGVMRRRRRKCNDCGAIRLCDMKRVCGRPIVNGDDTTYADGCGSTNISLVRAEESLNDSNSISITDSSVEFSEDTPEFNYICNELHDDAAAFLQDCIKSLPVDSQAGNCESNSAKILKIIADPKEGNDICKKCHENARPVCVENCSEQCTHAKMMDPKQCCGANSFSLDQCINYSAKIGQYLGFTASLANRRVKRVRLHVISFANKNKHKYKTAKHIALAMRQIDDE